MLDLGSGDGTSAALLVEAGHEVDGIDISASAVALARNRAPAATFEVGSFLDCELPAGRDAILAAGEVFGYQLDERIDTTSLERVLTRCASALHPGGLLLFDLAGPNRAPPAPRRSWNEGEGWAALVETEAEPGGERLTRRIITFRDLGDGRFRRGEEIHTLLLHEPSEVLAQLRLAGLTARTLRAGYAGTELPPGVTAYLARKPLK